jgi:hypothetical protein
MVDDTDDVGGEAPADTAPSSEPAPDPGEDLSSDIRAAVKTQRERGEDGKFKSSSKERGEPTSAAKGVATGTGDAGKADGIAGTAKAAPDSAPAPEPQRNRPPPGFSVATKQAWDALPQHVKEDIAKREAEVDAGFKRYGGLGKFADEAERNNTTLQAAVADYVQVETELRKDFLGGVEFLCQRLGVQPRALLAGLAQKYLPRQEGQPQPQAQPQQQFDPNAIATHAANMVRTEFQQREIESNIGLFAANPANRFFDNVRQDMAILVQAGKATDLQTAYEAACWLNPEIRAILLEESKAGQNRAATVTAVRAQKAAKAVSGAPSNSHAGDAPRRRDLSLDDEIRAAIDVQRGNA